MLAKWRRASLAAKRRFQTCLASLIDQTKLCEASKDRTTLTDSPCSLLFHCYRTRALENHARPHAVFTIRHPSYPSIWAYITHVTLDPRLPLFSCACIEKTGEPGGEAKYCIHVGYAYVQRMHKVNSHMHMKLKEIPYIYSSGIDITSSAYVQE